MKALYITSVEPYSGKTALCLGIGKTLQHGGFSVGYLKPVSTQPWRSPEGRMEDEDAVFVRRILKIPESESAQTPVIITDTVLLKRLSGQLEDDLVGKIQESAVTAAEGKDILLVEGGGSLREGYAMGLSNLRLAEVFGSPALVLVTHRRGKMQIIDDALAAKFRLGDLLLGVILNQIPEEEMDFVEDYARSYLENVGIKVLGAIPRVPRLSALSVGELQELLEGEILTDYYEPEALVESFTVGAMTLDAALSRFRRQQNKAVITGGDRSDIQLAALETSTVALILTGQLHPSPTVLHQAESVKVPVLLVKTNTMETVDKIESSYGRTRLGQPEKLETFMKLMDECVDSEVILAELGLTD
jgi:BioD-like phosphotransacetylase family protein